MRYTADSINDDALDELYARLDKLNRAVDRAHALTEEWAGDMTPVTRSAAADLFAAVIDLNGWEQTEPTTVLRAVPTPQ